MKQLREELSKQGSKDFFFEKKKQKTFAHGPSHLSTSEMPVERSEGPWGKVFCFFFSKKKSLLASSLL